MREHIFQGGKSKKFLYACSAQQTHNQRPPWTGPHSTYMYTQNRRCTRMESLWVLVWVLENGDTHQQTTLVLHKIAYLFRHTGTIFTMYCSLLQTFPTSNIQYGELFFRSHKYLFGYFRSRSTLNESKKLVVVTNDWWYFLRLRRSIRSSFIFSAQFSSQFIWRPYCLSQNMVEDDICHLNFSFGLNSLDSWTNKTENSASMVIYFVLHANAKLIHRWLNGLC